MRRSIRIGLFVLLLAGVVGGSALASRGPGANQTPSFADGSEGPEASEAPAGSDTPEAAENEAADEAGEAPEAPPTADELAHAVDRLRAQGLTVDPAQFEALASKYGLGGAVRLMAWSKSTGKTVADLSAMRDAGKGWGKIAHELGVSPGIGSIMGNGHDGSDEAGEAANEKDDADESPGESPNE